MHIQAENRKKGNRQTKRPARCSNFRLNCQYFHNHLEKSSQRQSSDRQSLSKGKGKQQTLLVNSLGGVVSPLCTDPSLNSLGLSRSSLPVSLGIPEQLLTVMSPFWNLQETQVLKWMDGAWHSSPRDKQSWLVSVSSAEGCHTPCAVLSRAWAETEQVCTLYARS